MPKESSYANFTPILTDKVRGIDDPGGSPATGNIVLQAVLDLFLANMAGATFTELVQDVVGALLSDQTEFDFTYNDAGNAEALALVAASVALTKLATQSQSTIVGRAAGAGTGSPTALSAVQAGNIINGTYADAGNSGTSKTLHLADGRWQKLTLTGNCTVTVDDWPAAGTLARLTLEVVQGAGPYTLAFTGGKVPQNGAVSLTQTSGDTTLIDLYSRDGGTTVFVVYGPWYDT